MAKFLCGGSPQDYTMFANVEDGATSSQAYVTGEYVVRNKVLREVIAPIAQGDTITVGTNLSLTGTNVGKELSELNSSLNVKYDESTKYIRIKVGDTWYNFRYFDPSTPTVLIPLIPAMTSNTAPSGVCSASSNYGSGYEAYKAFDGNSGTFWHRGNSAGQCWLQYQFPNAVDADYCVLDIDTSVVSLMEVCKIQASNDNSSWVDLTDDVKSSLLVDGRNSITITKNQGAYTYYRLYFGNAVGALYIKEVQFYNYG